MNINSLQTEPFNNGDQDGHLWHANRLTNMNAFDQLPQKIRQYINENFCHFPVEDILYDLHHEFNGNVDECLTALIEDNRVLAEFDKMQMTA